MPGSRLVRAVAEQPLHLSRAPRIATRMPSAAPASATRIRFLASDSDRRSDRVAFEIAAASALAAAATGGRMVAVAGARSVGLHEP